MDELLAAIPEPYRTHAITALAIMGALGPVLAALRPLLNRVPPGPARRWLEAVDLLAHVVAGNSRSLAARTTLPPKDKK